MSLRLLIADDHALMRAGIRSLLERTIDDVEILEATDGRSALDMATRARPDIVLMDITMPGLNGLDASRQIVRERPGCKVIMLSMHKDEARIVQAMRAGAVRVYGSRTRPSTSCYWQFRPCCEARRS